MRDTGGKRDRQQIDATLYDSVLYLSVLHENGASSMEAVSSLAKNANVFGSAAEEFCQPVSDVSFGYSLNAALLRLAETTPSKKLRGFLQGYAATIQTTGSATRFFRDTMTTLREERRILQQKFLSSLSVAAEVYLALFVACPLFAVISLMVLGMISGVDPLIPAVLMLVVFPLGTAVFLIAIDSFEPPKGKRKKSEKEREFRAFDRRMRIHDFVRHPIFGLTEKPWLVFFVSVPAAFLTLATPLSLYLQISVFFLVLFSPFAVFFSMHEKVSYQRLGAIPDLYQRLFDSMSQGETLSAAVHSAAEVDKNPLSDFVRRLSCDIRFSGSVMPAFGRFSTWLNLVSVDKAVVLLQETARFSSDCSKTLQELAFEARSDFLMMQERRSEMSLYVTVIYLGFFVFLFVMIILLTVFLDALTLASGASVLGFAAFSADAYASILIGSVLMHGVCSGLTAGKMSRGSILSGAKHACILLGAGVLVFVLAGILQ